MPVPRYDTPNPTTSQLLASCAAAHAVSTPPRRPPLDAVRPKAATDHDEAEGRLHRDAA
jgi:hypothetical protein